MRTAREIIEEMGLVRIVAEGLLKEWSTTTACSTSEGKIQR